MCHVHQCQQSRQVTHPALPELVSFPPAGAGLPLVGFMLLNVLVREVSFNESPCHLILLEKVKAFFTSGSIFAVICTQLPSSFSKIRS